MVQGDACEVPYRGPSRVRRYHCPISRGSTDGCLTGPAGAGPRVLSTHEPWLFCGGG
jgi:hypothetical protein